ncbi:MAG TPA: hypothetical protein ENL22_06895 [candidate division Zixibacteria bacterium]|nr:hypothetical protein [candidate division Zixibacteria bacterium]
MAEAVQRVEYFYAVVLDEPGEALRLLEFCNAHGVSLINFTAFPLGESEVQICFFPEDAQKLKMASEESGIPLVGPRKAFLIRGEDRLGVLIEFHSRLAKAGINIYAANGTTDGHGGFGYILWVEPYQYEEAARVLGV